MFGRLLQSIYDSIPSSIEKNRIQTALTEQEKKVRSTLLVALDIDDDMVKDTVIYKDLDRVFKGNKNYKGNPIDYVRQVAEWRMKHRDVLLEAVDAVFGNKVYREALDYKQMHLTMYIAAFDRFIESAFAFVTTAVNEVVYKDEANPYAEPSDKFSKKHIYDRDNQLFLKNVCDAFGKDAKEFLDKIDEMDGIDFNPKDMEITARQYKLQSNKGTSLGFIPVAINPGYIFGSLYNLWYKKSFEEAEELVTTLQLKIQRLERSKRFEDDPEAIAEIDKQIEYNMDRLNKLQQEIEDILEDA